MTLEEAKSLKYHQEVISGKGYVYRVNGQVKTWKRNPNRVSVPIKWGFEGKLARYGYITEYNLDYWTIKG